MNGDAEHSPTEAETDPIGYILDRWLARRSGLLRDGRTFRSRLRDAGTIEHGAIAVEAAAAIEEGAAGDIEAARLLRAYAKRGGGPDTRQLPAVRRARWRWRLTAKVISAVAALMGAGAALWKAIGK